MTSLCNSWLPFIPLRSEEKEERGNKERGKKKARRKLKEKCRLEYLINRIHLREREQRIAL
jgi:hypothetical protein